MNCSAPPFPEKGQIANILGFVSHVISVLTTQLSQCRANIPHGTKQATGSTLWSSTIMQEQAAAPHSRTLTWKTPWMEESGGLQSTGSLRVGHDWATSLSFFTFMHGRRKWHPTPVLLPGESQGQGSLVGCCLWGCTESDTTEVT